MSFEITRLALFFASGFVNYLLLSSNINNNVLKIYYAIFYIVLYLIVSIVIDILDTVKTMWAMCFLLSNVLCALIGPEFVHC